MVGMRGKGERDPRAEPCLEDSWADRDAEGDRSFLSPPFLWRCQQHSFPLSPVLQLQMPLEHFPTLFPAPAPSPHLATVSCTLNPECQLRTASPRGSWGTPFRESGWCFWETMGRRVKKRGLSCAHTPAQVLSQTLKVYTPLSLLPRKSTFTRSLTTSCTAKKTSK